MSYPLPLASQELYTKYFQKKITLDKKECKIVWVGTPLNCRFKSLLSPYDVFTKTHRNIPHFFKPLNIKPFTKIGFNFIKKINEKK